MTRFLKSEAGAVVAWVAFSIVLAAVISPWLYGWGKEFAMAHHDGEGFWAGIAGSCERAKFSRYFNRALMLSAVILVWPLWWQLRRISRQRKVCPRVLLPGLPIQSGMVHALVGFVVAAGLLWVLGVILQLAGAFVPAPKPAPLGMLFENGLVPALGASLVEEWLFRSLLLGLWLRISGPWAACIGTSMLFAFVHFLEPPHGMEIADPREWNAGFALVGLILKNYLSPTFLTAEVLTLFVVGLSLAWARLKTASLWLPFGMHAGWIFAFKAFNMCHEYGSRDLLSPLMIGNSLRSGLLPVATLLITWLALAWTIKWLPGTQGGAPAGKPTDTATPSEAS